MKRCLLLFVLIILSAGLLTAQARAVRTFTAVDTNGACSAVGVQVPVSIDVADDLLSYQFKLYYDSTLLTYNSVTAGPVVTWSPTGAPGSDANGDYVSVAAASATPIPAGTGSAVMAYVNFDVAAGACDGATSPLAFSDPPANLYSTSTESDVQPTLVDGTFTISCPANPAIGAVTNVAPTDGATGQATNVTIDWNDTANADTYDLYLDTNNPPTTLVGPDLGVSQYTTAGLANSTTYYWYVVASNSGNSCAPVSGPVWSFTTVAGATPDMAYDSNTFIDACSFGGAGDNNGAADPGETLDITVTLVNNGGGNATGVSALLSTTTTGVTVTTNSANYPDIAAAATGASTTPYVVDIADTVACGTTIDFSLAITSNEGSWNDTFQLQVGSTTAVVLNEKFESWPPPGWNIVNNGGDCVWDTTANTGRPNYAGGDGNAADADSDLCGSGTTMDTELWTPAIDLSTATGATLDFIASYNYLSSDSFEVDVSTDGGTNWTNLLSWNSDHSPFGPGEAVNLDLTPYVGSANTYVRFHYVAPAWDWYAEVDDVTVTVTAASPICTVCTAPCTPPAAFSLLSPADTATGQPTTNLVLDWADSTGATSYTVYLDTANPPVTVEASGVASSAYTVPGPLTAGTTYYWQVVATNGCAPDATSAVWSFTTAACTPPAAFNLLSPADTATGQATANLVLDWADSTGATSYTVYLDTANPPVTVEASGVASSTYTVPGPLTAGTTYYWQVVATNGCAPDATSAVWSFTTSVTATTMSVTAMPGNCGTTVSVPITIDESNGMLSFQFDLYYSPTYITGVSAAPAGVASGFTVTSNVYADHISVAGASGTPAAAGGGTICTVDLAIDSATPDGTVTLLDLQAAWVDDVAMAMVDANLTVTCLLPDLAYQGNAFTDLCPYAGPGNGDGVADPGETLYVTVTLANNGAAAATNVSAVMSTTTPGAWIGVNNSTYPDIPTAGTGTSNTQYIVNLDPTFTCGDAITLDLAITSAEGTWNDSFQITSGVRSRATVLTEDFEVWPPTGWTIINNGGCGVWESSSTTGQTNDSGGSGNAADADSDWCGSAMDTELQSPSVDLTSSTAATLTFQSDFQSWLGTDTADVDISTDGGTTWTNILNIPDDEVPPVLHTIDLTPYVGNVITIRFHYVAPGWDWYWLVDDVTIDATGGGGTPSCNVCEGAPCAQVGQVNYVAPENGATDLEPPVTLEWEPAANADHYDVYFGTNPNNLAFLGTTTGTTYTVENLEPSTTYSWLVQGVNDCSFRNGLKWSFTTAGAAPGMGSTDQFVAAAAEAAGARDTHWQTDVRIFNPSYTQATWTITFIPSDTDGTQSSYIKTGTIAGMEELVMDDILPTLFNLTETVGALHVESNLPLIVTSRTYTSSENGGTYGQFIPAVDIGNAMGAGAKRSLLRQSSVGHIVMLSKNDTWRTNMGFVEVTGNAVTVNVTLYGADNTNLGSGSFDILPLGHHQVNDIFGALGITDNVDAARAEITLSGNGSILAYASMVDRGTGDAVYLPAQTIKEEGMGQQMIPVVASANGANDTHWKTELRLYNLSDDQQTVTLLYASKGSTYTVNLNLDPHAISVNDNVLKNVFSIVGDTFGSLTITAPEGVIAAARTYTSNDLGTYGQSAAPVTTAFAMAADTTGYLIHLSQDEDHRGNVGFAEIGAGDVLVGVDVYDKTGAYLGSTGFGMEAYGIKQLNEVVKTLELDPLENGYIRYRVVSGSGSVLPYLSVVDNISGDAIFIQP